jgi:hypothetical protein
MKYFIKKELDTQTVSIEANGIINTDLSKEMVLAVGAELNYTGFQKCFFDLTSTDIDPEQKMLDIYMFVKIFLKASINEFVKMAVITKSKNEFYLYLEKAANSEGYNLKHFTSRNDALNWLNI